MFNREAQLAFSRYTIDKIQKYLLNLSTQDRACICGVECDTMGMILMFPLFSKLETLLLVNENLDEYLSNKGK